MKLATACAVLLIFGATATAQAQDPNLARNLAATCANCHGTDGQAVGGMETLAGAPAERTFKKVMDYRSGELPATIMHQIAKGYTEEQIRLIADYFAARK